jgi:hypothetical protein
MATELDRIRKTTPDLAHLDPLSMEVRAWLDSAYEAVRKVDRAEGVVLRLHQRDLSDPARKDIASAEITKAVERTATMRVLLQRMGV